MLKKQFDVFMGKNLRLESKLTKRLSSVRLLACFGVVRFRLEVKGFVNIFGSNFLLPKVKIFHTHSAENYRLINAVKRVPYRACLRENEHLFRCQT